MGMLARRDHSELELRQKLAKKQCPPEDIDIAIEHCHYHGWLDDKRFAEATLRHGVAKGHGWQRICFDAKRKGITTPMLEAAQENQQHDWYELAKELAIRRFADLDGFFPDVDFKQRAKWTRYLQSRGFSFDQINYAFSKES
ncbi:RecX family transcriptional regulator [Enterovibrio norvegicus FF-33]|uniref:Regulatory protein RecX n=1 Tax=Enterovibrio norvegicus FF-454 TaxID=1185651 RepID=A0A1E5C835_9GAMM|nr:RecX family transcriptional regulator [Enterovibrio norvegicus FF-454]OEE66469.1 RecX family transcriptional regulator [Enterovibrio norvegicus FF-33]OEE88360.1 RecX family transcriptional regulator [Enterovibrio norvegicus FF-162]